VLFFLLPLYALIVCVGVQAAVGLIFPKFAHAVGLSPRDRRAALAAGVLGLGLSVGLSTLKQVDFRGVREGTEPLSDFLVATVRQGPSFAGLLTDGYGLPCGYGWHCDRTPMREFSRLAEVVGPEDIVISDLPMETNYFVGHVTAWLYLPRDERDPTIDPNSVDEYFGRPIVDTPEEVADLADSGSRVWIIARTRTGVATSETRQRMLDTLATRFQLYQQGTHFDAYTNR
jgi:hypothetical protein